MGLDLGTCAPCPAQFPRAGGSDPGLGAGSVNPPCLAPRTLAALCSFPTLPALAGGDPPSRGVKPLCVSLPGPAPSPGASAAGSAPRTGLQPLTGTKLPQALPLSCH